MLSGSVLVTAAEHDSRPKAKPEVDASEVKTRGSDVEGRHLARPFHVAMCVSQKVDVSAECVRHRAPRGLASR